MLAVTIEDEERSIPDAAVHMTPREHRADRLTLRFAENGARADETILPLSGSASFPLKVTDALQQIIDAVDLGG